MTDAAAVPEVLQTWNECSQKQIVADIARLMKLMAEGNYQGIWDILPHAGPGKDAP